MRSASSWGKKTLVLWRCLGEDFAEEKQFSFEGIFEMPP